MSYYFFVFFVIYFLAFMFINSYAMSNDLGSKNFFAPQEWFGETTRQEKTLTPTTLPPSPSPLPTTQPVTIKNSSSGANTGGQIDCIGPDGKKFKTTEAECKKLNEAWGKQTDYLVNCTMHANCGGGIKRIKKSECNNGTCCQIGNNWIFYTSKDKCSQDQRATTGSNNLPRNDNLVAVPVYDGTWTYYCKPEVVQAIKELESIMSRKSKEYVSKCVVADPPLNCENLQQDAYNAEDNYKALIFGGSCTDRK